MKKCQFCAEEIQNDAIKCKHCKSDISKQSKNESLDKYKGLAITSFVFGVLSVFFGSIGIIPLIALIIGIVSLFKLKQMKKGNKIFAIIGFVLALVYSINFILVFSSIGPNILGINYTKYNKSILTKQTVDDDFNKKNQCAEKKSNIKAELESIVNEKKSIRKIDLEEIFYSKKINTCLFVAKYFDHNFVFKFFDYGEVNEPYQVVLKDALTGNAVESGIFFDYYNEDGSRNKETWDKLEKLYQKIDTYK